MAYLHTTMLDGDFVLLNQPLSDIEYEVLSRPTGDLKWETRGRWWREDTAVKQAKALAVEGVEATVEIHKMMHYTYMRIRDGKVNNQW